MFKKPEGIVKTLDHLDRLQLPKNIIEKLEFKLRQTVDIFLNDNGDLVIRKFAPGCTFCGKASDTLTEHLNKLVCKDCRTELSKK